MRSIRQVESFLTRSVFVGVMVIVVASAMPGYQEESGPQAGRATVLTVRVESAITPVSAGFIERAIEEAEESGAECLVIELDTPGGLMESTRQIVKNILSSKVPIVVYVSPQGARAASAGVFITLASHIAAMAPATHIGAAHPVQIGTGPGQPAPDEQKETDTGGGVMEEKIVNDARAWARTLAELRGRNAEWAASAVSESKSIPSSEALDLNVIDYVANNLSQLLGMIDGLEVETDIGSTIVHTRDAEVRPVEMWWGERILSLLSDPNLAFLLLMLGFYGILFEFYTPGWGVAGTTGVICLVLAFFGLAVLPVNYAGLVLIFLAIGLFVAEAFFPSFGMLTVGGAICLVLGGVMLIDSPWPVMRVSLAVVLPVAIGSAVVAFFLAGRAVQSFSIPVQTGAEGMVGEKALAKEIFRERNGRFYGTVLVHGELWRAESAQDVAEGETVSVIRCEGLTLTVGMIDASGRAISQGTKNS